jgi:hypothetical protein
MAAQRKAKARSPQRHRERREEREEREKSPPRGGRLEAKAPASG